MVAAITQGQEKGINHTALHMVIDKGANGIDLCLDIGEYVKDEIHGSIARGDKGSTLRRDGAIIATAAAGGAAGAAAGSGGVGRQQ